MEQARYWMLTKRKQSLNSSHFQASTNNPSSFDDSSWEEQAFAEDAAGPLGGCIWPPRSYSCSFCRREFRSAQALGGHMNVHRRDRARLKQSPTSPEDNDHQILHQFHHDQHQNPFTSFGFQYPSSQLCTLVYSPNPNSINPGINIASPTTSSPRVSIAPSQENCREKPFFPPFSSFNNDEQLKKTPGSSPPLRPKFAMCTKGEENSRMMESTGCRAKVDYVKADLSVSLNLVLRRSRPNISSDDEEEEEEEVICNKKRRIDHKSSLPFFVKSSDSVETSSCSPVEELDLELRLGDRPKVK